MDTMNDFLERNGYEGLNPFNADVIFRTNMQTAYNAGHYKSMTNPTTKKLRPFWKYITAGDGEVRESHAQMEGRIYPADDPIWDIWYPPNGFRCRCTVVSLTKSQAIEYLKGNYDDFLCRSATIVRQDIDLTIYLSKDVSTSGVKEQAEYIIENTLKLTDREDMNCLYLDSIRVALAGGISDYRKSVISKPNNDIELNKGNVILLGNLNVQVTNVGGGESDL